jgi:hypothetical protein
MLRANSKPHLHARQLRTQLPVVAAEGIRVAVAAGIRVVVATADIRVVAAEGINL